MSGSIDETPDVLTLTVHDHPCAVYESLDELKIQCIPFLQAGLLLGERSIYFFSDNSPAFVMEAMTENGFSVEPYLKNGAFKVIPTSEVHLSGGSFDEEKMMQYWRKAVEDSKQEGFQSLRAAVEMSWALSGKPGCDVLAPYESRLNSFTSTENVAVICAYHRERFSPEKLRAVIHAHPKVIAGSKVLLNDAVVSSDHFVEDDANLDVQATLDNLGMIAELNTINSELRRANEQLKAQEEQVKNIYDQLVSVSQELADKSDLLEEYAWVAAHELKEPVRVIATYSKLVKEDYKHRLDSDGDLMLGMIMEAAEKAIQRIDAVLQFSGLTSGEITRGRVELNSVVEQVKLELGDWLEKENGRIESEELPAIFGNQELITISFLNLVGNSLKYRSEEDPLIKIETVEQDAEKVIIAVTDNGIGLENAEPQQIFGMFKRISIDKPGMGLGLSTVKRIIQSHGGKIWFDAGENSQTTFYIQLPSS